MLHHPSSVRIARSVRRRESAGFSLIEIVAALILTGILAAVSTHRLQNSAAGVLDTAVTTQSLVQELGRMRQLAIRSAEPHGIRFDRTNGKVTSLTFYRRTPVGTTVRVGTARDLPTTMNLITKDTVIEFNTEGSTQAGTAFLVSASKRTWQITVAPLTGIVSLNEV